MKNEKVILSVKFKLAYPAKEFCNGHYYPEKLTQAGGHRYIKARRPALYRDIIG